MNKYTDLPFDNRSRFTYYRQFASLVRINTLRMIHKAKSAHIGSCYSIADLLTVLYNGVLKVNPQYPDWEDRDRFILSKGHASAVTYAVLAELGFFPKEWLETFYLDAGKLKGHVTHDVPGIEASTGSLGHGLSVGCGIALAAKRDNRPYKTFVLLGDGECEEGSVWEAIMFASHHKLDNLIAIVDYNKIQSFGTINEVMNLEPFAEKWKAFGWTVKEIDGHNFEEIEDSCDNVPFVINRPSCIIAHTIKGKGVGFMENKLKWHYGPVNDADFKIALAELEETSI